MAAGQTPLNIATLYRMLAVSERGLRNAFHRVHGIPPHRRLRMLMLSQVRRALISARGPSANVTSKPQSILAFCNSGVFRLSTGKCSGKAVRKRCDSQSVNAAAARLLNGR